MVTRLRIKSRINIYLLDFHSHSSCEFEHLNTPKYDGVISFRFGIDLNNCNIKVDLKLHCILLYFIIKYCYHFDELKRTLIELSWGQSYNYNNIFIVCFF